MDFIMKRHDVSLTGKTTWIVFIHKITVLDSLVYMDLSIIEIAQHCLNWWPTELPIETMMSNLIMMIMKTYLLENKF